jgi:uncharacterized membrane protein
LFTAPAVIVQPITGVLLMQATGFSLRSSWLSIAIVLYCIAGACWLPVVALQLRVRSLSERALRAGTALPQQYFRCMRWWFALGWPAFAAVLATFWLMVAKPSFW